MLLLTIPSLCLLNSIFCLAPVIYHQYIFYHGMNTNISCNVYAINIYICRYTCTYIYAWHKCLCVYNVDVAVWLSCLIYLGAIVQSFPQKLDVLEVSFIFEDIYKSTYTSLTESTKRFLKWEERCALRQQCTRSANMLSKQHS